ncbi:hypothetical protein [Cupriavidus pauculus]|uniref:hypothetical protein n=1 Tax=Cupriavidus pauculus TaxID=82633 RepID=UPI001EE1B631|nr:hypothetical protein [Cupriavidus pauculus]GJG94945.1 hypothetical protein CBA19C6_10670 [Cupriavidus pauculus]
MEAVLAGLASGGVGSALSAYFFLHTYTNEKLAPIGETFERLDKRVDRLDVRVDRVEVRLAKVEARLDVMDEKLNVMNEKITALDKRFVGLEGKVDRILEIVAMRI